MRRALLTLWLPITIATLLPVLVTILSESALASIIGAMAAFAAAIVAYFLTRHHLSRRSQESQRLERKLSATAAQVRRETILRQATTGYLATNLSVVELAVALHHVFTSAEDKLIWDGADQSSPHNILQDWKDESHEANPHAPYFASALSEGLGKAVARDLSKGSGDVVCVLRDGAFSAGMSYEALNNAGAMNSRLIVILNDSDAAVAPPVSAMSAYLARLYSSEAYLRAREATQRLSRHFPRSIANYIGRLEEFSRGLFTGGTLFESLGFYYIGPIDGHNLSHLVPVLRNVRDATRGPVLVHVVTQIGKRSSELSASNLDDQETPPTYSHIFAESLIHQAYDDTRIVAVTAGMPAVTGVDRFEKAFPSRAFNVGLAEQHAIAFCAGLAESGYKPFAIIYSTFLQRAYDQIVREVAIRKLAVRFAINGSSLNSEQIEARTGIFDIANLSNLPGFVVMAPSDEVELVHMTATQVAINDRPSAVRFPHAVCARSDLPKLGVPLEIGKGRIIREGSKVALLSLGTRLKECERAADALIAYGLPTTVADARFAAPLDVELIVSLAAHHEVLITVEEGARGGFGASVMLTLAENGIYNTRIRSMFVVEDYSKSTEQRDLLDSSSIVLSVLEVLQIDDRRVGPHTRVRSDHSVDSKLPYASFEADDAIPNLFRLKAHKPQRR